MAQYKKPTLPTLSSCHYIAPADCRRYSGSDVTAPRYPDVLFDFVHLYALSPSEIFTYFLNYCNSAIYAIIDVSSADPSGRSGI